MPMNLKPWATASLLAASLFAAPAAQAVPVEMLAMKLSDSTTTANDLDAYLGWQNAGGWNESNASAKLLVDNGLDYKNSFVDTHWGQVLSVRVAMFSGGVQQAFIRFNAAGTTKMNFFAAANVHSSTYTDLGDGGLSDGGQFFSIQGHDTINRHWFINNNYGGCGADVGQWVVKDRGGPACVWESSRYGSNDRAFLYALGSVEQNWNTANIGVADVYAVFVTIDQPGNVPEPGSLALLGLGGLLLGAARRRRTPG